MDKQIEGMEKLIVEKTAVYDRDVAQDVAEALYNAGYRKASEVAREIFEEIEALIEPNGNNLWQWDLNKLAELKKKRTEDKKDGN